jgi:hypothetical protein
MLTAPTMEHLQALKLDTMAAAWTAQQQQADLTAGTAYGRHHSDLGSATEYDWVARLLQRSGASAHIPPPPAHPAHDVTFADAN